MASGSNINDINQQAYSNIQSKKVYASADNNENAKIESSEAKKRKGSIFSNNDETVLNEVINDSKRLSSDKKTLANSVIKKYLGGISLTGFLNNFAGFAEINYSAVTIKDKENEADVKAQIDSKIDTAIESQFTSIMSDAKSSYKKEIQKALKQAENELVGDEDIEVKGKVKGKDNNFDLSKIKYERSSTNDENTNVATFNSSINTKDEKTQGYINTTEYLKSNGAKVREKTVNGVKQSVYEVKVNGEKQFITVDDAGQVHELERDKGFLRTSKFTTKDSIEDAKYQAGENIDKNTKVKVRVRKVDGQKQSVMSWKDDSGNKYSRVIDYNNATGSTSSAEVHQVNAGGSAKYASETSGLGALVNKNSKDNYYFDNKKHKLHTDTWTDNNGGIHNSYAGTEGRRMKLDAKNIDLAINNMKTIIGNNGKLEEQDNNVTVMINNHTYTFDKTDNKNADRVLRLIKGEIDRIKEHKPENIPEQKDITLKPFEIVEDNRIDANIKRDGTTKNYPDGSEYTSTNETWKSGGTVQHAGVDENSHVSSEGGNGKINRVRYNNSFTKDKFRAEGWSTDSNRTKELEYLKLMDNNDIKNGDKSVRNLTTANEFAERFVKAYNSKNSSADKYDISSLTNAIIAANPSLFDNNGKMYRNADFSRLNLPKDITGYRTEIIAQDNESDSKVKAVILPKAPETNVDPVRYNPVSPHHESKPETKPVVKDRGLNDEESDSKVKSVTLPNVPETNVDPVIYNPVSPHNESKPQTKPVVKDRGLNDEEIEQYINNDENYKNLKKHYDYIDKKMKEIEAKYNFERSNDEQALRARFDMSSEDDNAYFNYKFFMTSKGNEFEQSFKNTLRKWEDTPKDADVSKFFMRRNTKIITEVRKETLPDGTKVYHAKEGYYNLYYDGGFGSELSEEDLKKHGLE